MKKAPKKVVKPQAAPAAGGNSWNIQEKALKEMERGLQQLHKQNYDEALPHFQAILDGFPHEKELVDRVKVYARVCRASIDTRKEKTHKPEEYFYLGVMKANEANFDEAVEYLDRALQVDPRDERSHYVMASTRALRGERDLAIQHLKEAIALNVTNRAYAQNDPDFEPLRTEDEFQNLIHPEEA